MNKRTNAGYTIIAEITIPGDQFVLGEKIDADNNAQYVTWRSDGEKYYCYGRYFTNKKTALLNFYERARSEIEHRVKCTAIFNWYTCSYYADDKYGIVKE